MYFCSAASFPFGTSSCTGSLSPSDFSWTGEFVALQFESSCPRRARLNSVPASNPPARLSEAEGHVVPGHALVPAPMRHVFECLAPSTEPCPTAGTENRSEEHTSELQSPCNLVC